MNIIDEFLQEAKAKSKMVKVSKMAQIDRQAGAEAMRMAKNKKDPLYDKYTKWNKKRKELKAKIKKKYGMRAKKAVKKTMM